MFENHSISNQTESDLNANNETWRGKKSGQKKIKGDSTKKTDEV